MEIATIGFTKSSAERFFGRIRSAGIERLVDIRLNNRSQLSGFTKTGDLAYFLGHLCGVAYEHDKRLSPSPELLVAYRKKEISWNEYEDAFLDLMEQRNVPAIIERDPYQIAKTVLLCSEPAAERCHRRLVAELMSEAWGVRVEHL